MKKISIFILILLLLISFMYFLFADKNNLEQDNVSIGMVTFPGYAPLYLAKEKNLFEDINVNLVRIESIGDLRSAMNSNRIDMYIATPDIFQSTENQEPPGIGFLAIDESSGADGIAISSDINNILDLKGKKVGAEPGFPPYFILQYLLNQNNMSLKDIEFKDISSQNAGGAFVAGKFDAIGTYEPYLSKSVNLRKDSKVLLSSKDTKGLIVDIMFANQKLAKNRPEILKKIADGWFQALDYYKSNKDESMEIMAKSFGVSKDEMIEIKSGIIWLDKNDNKELFNKKLKSNIYKTFDLVGDILTKNNSSGFKVFSKEKITDKTINLYEK